MFHTVVLSSGTDEPLNIGLTDYISLYLKHHSPASGAR